jgi:hypothetical protein
MPVDSTFTPAAYCLTLFRQSDTIILRQSQVNSQIADATSPSQTKAMMEACCPKSSAHFSSGGSGFSPHANALKRLGLQPLPASLSIIPGMEH